MTGTTPGGGTDSAGVPWRGRTFALQPFTGDEGGAEPALAAALAGYAEGRAVPADVVTVLARSRVLVPVVAVLGEPQLTDAGLDADTSADMALVTLAGPAGGRALPVFTSTASLAAWDAAARPVPVESARAALSAVAEGCDRLLVDLAGPHRFVVSRPAVWALAQGRPWVPSPQDPDVVAAVTRAATGVDGVAGVRCEPGTSHELRVVLGVRTGLDRAALDAVVTRVGVALAREPDVAERVETMELVVLPA